MASPGKGKLSPAVHLRIPSTPRIAPRPFAGTFVGTFVLVALLLLLLAGCRFDGLVNVGAPYSGISAGSSSGGSSGGGGSGGDSGGGVTPPQSCGTGLASQDLAGQCRASPQPTMGALEVPGTVTATAYSSAIQVASLSTLVVTWQPYPGEAAGYMIYYGPTAENAATLASDLPAGPGAYDPRAPSVTYRPGQDLGLYSGDHVCFRIFAYDVARALSDWSELVCTVVS
jgi:hypothetical protein